MLKKYEKQICLIIVIAMFFAGRCFEMLETDSSFLCAKNAYVSSDAIEADSYVVESTAICPLNMIYNGTTTICRNLGNSVMRWQGSAVLLFCIVGMFSQYLFYYQSCECKEDGQLLLCRSVAVKYIHQKDGEK